MRLEFKTILVNLGYFLQQEMQSCKYKNKVGIIHCTSKRVVRQQRCREGCGLEGAFDPNISPCVVVWNSQDMKPPLTEEPNPVFDTVCMPLLFVVSDCKVWGQECTFLFIIVFVDHKALWGLS